MSVICYISDMCCEILLWIGLGWKAAKSLQNWLEDQWGSYLILFPSAVSTKNAQPQLLGELRSHCPKLGKATGRGMSLCGKITGMRIIKNKKFFSSHTCSLQWLLFFSFLFLSRQTVTYFAVVIQHLVGLWNSNAWPLGWKVSLPKTSCFLKFKSALFMCWGSLCWVWLSKKRIWFRELLQSH